MLSLDIRWPLGLIFTLIGGILIVYGISAGSVAGADINAGWGCILMLFGVVMLLLARAAQVHKRHD